MIWLLRLLYLIRALFVLPFVIMTAGAALLVMLFYVDPNEMVRWWEDVPQHLLFRWPR